MGIEEDNQKEVHQLLNKISEILIQVNSEHT